MKYEAVIGLEVHVQLKTNTKIFCGCSSEFGSSQNSNVCEVCLGHPGTLPVMNEKVLEYGVKTALALGCKIAHFSKMDRKNYYYPDLPKNYQISQYDIPFSYDGKITVVVDGNVKDIGITRAHLEEDAGKLIHDDLLGCSKVDYNRTGTPLVEIVSEPDMRSPEEAFEYLKNLKAILQYIDVSDCNMEEGSLRCDANVSIRPEGQKELGTKTEIKNLNSFKNVQKALQYEIRRQTEVLGDGGVIVQETRLWNADKEESFSMRTKEEAHDYRYFPEPDLVPIILEDAYIDKIKTTIPELPEARKKRFVKQYDIPEYDAGVLTSVKAMADYFEACCCNYDGYKKVSNWMMGELLKALNDTNTSIEDIKVTSEMLVDLIKLVDNSTINGKMAKDVFAEMFASGKKAGDVVSEKGLVQISDESLLEDLAKQVIQRNPKSVADFKSGKEKAIGALVGQIMKETKGKANPKIVNDILRKHLNS